MWRVINPNPVVRIEFSPDERLFATLAEYDRLIKVWYRMAIEKPEPQPDITFTGHGDMKHSSTLNEAPPSVPSSDNYNLGEPLSSLLHEGHGTSSYKSMSFSYIYLAHPKAVTHFEWRRKDIGAKRFVANVLLTTARDNVVRIWTETFVDEQLDFYICHAIRRDNVFTAQWLNSPIEISSNDVVLRYLPKDIRLQQIPYNGGHNIMESDEKKEDLHSTGHDSLIIQQRVDNSSSVDYGLIESHSWMCTVEHDGSIVVDLIHGLSDYPRRTPKLSTWIHMPNAFQQFTKPIKLFMFYNSNNEHGGSDAIENGTSHQNAVDLGYPTPNSITIYVHDEIGCIESRIMDIGKGIPRVAPKLFLHTRYTGHRAQIDKVISHPSLPLVASISTSDNELIVWHVRDTTLYSPVFILTNIQDYRVKLSEISWFPSAPALFVSTDRGIEILYVKSESPVCSIRGISENSPGDIYPPLPSYYDINTTGVVLERSNEGFQQCQYLEAVHSRGERFENGITPFCALVVAISEDGRSVGVWQVKDTGTRDAYGVEQFENKLLLRERFSVRVTCADCHKSKPFVYDIDQKGKIVASTTDPHNNTVGDGFIVLAVGTEDGQVIAYKLEHSDKKDTDDSKLRNQEVPKQPPPKVGFGGLLSKFAQVNYDSDSDSNESESDEDEEEDPNSIEEDGGSARDEMTMTMTKWLSFKAEAGPVHKIICCHLATARMATVSENSNVVHIWEAESHQIPSLEQTIEITEVDAVTGLSWHTYDDGYYILSIASRESIICFTESRLRIDEPRYWIQFAKLMAPSFSDMNTMCKSMSMTSNKALVAGYGSKLFVYSKWTEQTATTSGRSNAKTFSLKAIELHNRLPDYHPSLLREMLMLGRFDLVKEILDHLAQSIKIQEDRHEYLRTRTMNDDNDHGDMEMYIPSIPIRRILKKKKKQKEQTNQSAKRMTLFDKYAHIKDNDTDDEDDSEGHQRQTETASGTMNFVEIFKILDISLVKYRLPGLTGVEQMNLIALVNTFQEIQEKPDALDDCAVRFMVASRYLFFIRKARKLDDLNLTSANFAWAMQSETQDTLWEGLHSGRLAETNRLTWRYFVQLGITYWVTNPSLLRNLAEELAKDQFRANGDPIDCALIYVALKKQSTLMGLFKVKKNERLVEFFQRDFTQEKNQIAACKNAYVLIGRQQFEYAAAFFLMADRPVDAIDILLKRAKDPVLAFFVLRLYAGDDSELTRGFARDRLMPIAREKGDRWLQSVLLWFMNDYERSLEVLTLHCAEDHSSEHFDPSLYEYCKHIALKPQLRYNRLMLDNREAILLRVAHYYSQSGAMLLSIDYLQQIKERDDDLEQIGQELTKSGNVSSLLTGEIDMHSFGGFEDGSFFSTKNNDRKVTSSDTKYVTSSAPTNQNASARDIRNRDEHMALLKLKLSLSVMAHEARLLSAQPAPTVDKDWDENVRKLGDNLEYLELEFGVDRRALIKKLKRFCVFSGLLIARCMLFSFRSADLILDHLNIVSHQVSSLPALIYKNLLTPAQRKVLANGLEEFIYCYRRIIECEAIDVPHSTHADFCATVYIILFIIAWSHRDFDAIYVLYTIPEKLDPYRESSSSNTASLPSTRPYIDQTQRLCQALSDNLPLFYDTYMREISDMRIVADVERRLKQEEEMDHSIHHLGTQANTAETKSSTEDDQLLFRLEKEYHFQQLESSVVFKFASNLKAFLDRNYATLERASHSNTVHVDYSINAQTAILGFSLWCRFLEKRTQDIEMEIFTVSSHLPTPNLKEINALLSHSSLANLTDMLSYSRPSISRGGPSTFTNRLSKKKKNRSKSQHRRFHSLIHAIPELEIYSNTKHQFVKPLVRIKMKNAKTFANIPSVERVWKLLENHSGERERVEEELHDSNHDIEQTDSKLGTEAVSFSAPIEIVKCREPIRSFCIEHNNPVILAYATSKGIREINIEHSILYRKRNPTLDLLLDEEALTWETSLHRFDMEASQDIHHATSSAIASTSMSHVPNNWTFDMGNYLSEMAVPVFEERLGSISSPLSPSSELSISEEEAVHQRRRRPHFRALRKLKKRLSIAGMRRRPTFTTHTPTASHFNTRTGGKLTSMPDIDHNQPVAKLISHPFLPFYLSGGLDGAVRMWQFGFPHAVRTYREPGSPQITSIRFARFGYKFAATDTTGTLSLWKFETSKESLRVFDTIKCHASRANDFSFLDSGSVIGTIGVGGSAKNLCIWDVLLPKYESCLVKENLQEEPLVMAYSPRYRNIIIGGKRGFVKIYDLRMNRFLPTPDSMSHASHVETISLDIAEEFFVTGSVDGEVKVWDLATFETLSAFDDVRTKHKLFESSSHGVTASNMTASFLYTGNSEGVISRRVIL